MPFSLERAETSHFSPPAQEKEGVELVQKLEKRM